MVQYRFGTNDLLIFLSYLSQGCSDLEVTFDGLIFFLSVVQNVRYVTNILSKKHLSSVSSSSLR